MFKRFLRCLPFMLFLGLLISSVYAATRTFTFTYQDLLDAYAPSHYYPRMLEITKDPHVSTSWTVRINHTVQFDTSKSYPMFGFIITEVMQSGSYDNVSIPQVRIHFFVALDNTTRFTVFYNNGTSSYRTPNLGGYHYVLPVTVKVVNSTIQFWDNGLVNVTVTDLIPVKPLYLGYRSNPSGALLSGNAVVTIDFDAPITNLTQLVIQFIPVILMIAMLSMAVAMCNKLSKG